MTVHHIVIEAVTVGRDPLTDEVVALLHHAGGEMVTDCVQIMGTKFESTNMRNITTGEITDLTGEVDVMDAINGLLAEPVDPENN